MRVSLFHILSLAAVGLTAPTPQSSGSTYTDAQTKVDFMVSGPLPFAGNYVTDVDLGSYTFSNSWGKPYVTTYQPPSEQFTHVRIKMDVSSSGIQYDRLARIYIGGSEIWRSSTAEPTGGPMSYSFTKDVTKYLALFKNTQDVVFDLGNTVNDQFTGAYLTKLTVQFYYNPGGYDLDNNGTVFDSLGTTAPSTNILAIRPADKPSNQAFSYTLPTDTISFSIPALPRNTTKAVLDIFASGNGNDEFWYYNMQPENSNAFAQYGYALPGNYPSRLIEVSVDDDLSGITLPFPIIFTGGLNPSLWIPNVGINAFDLPTYPIDLTPLLPKLWEGANLKIKITTGFGNLASNDWYVNANLHTWQKSGVQGSGTVVAGINNNNNNKYSDQPTGGIIELLSLTRDLSTQAILSFNDSNGSTEEAYVKSSQTMSFTNTKYFYNQGNYRKVAQVSAGFNMLYVTKPGTDLSNYRNGGLNTDSMPSGFSVVFDGYDTDSNLQQISKHTYIYPLVIADYSTGSSRSESQTDIYRGFMYEDASKGVWTRQNSSVTQGLQAGEQYLVERLNSGDSFDQFVSTNGHAVVMNTTGNPSVPSSVAGFAQNDGITTLVSRAAQMAYSQKNNKEMVSSAIKNVFDFILPAAPGSTSSTSSSLSKRIVDSVYEALGRSPFGKRAARKDVYEQLGRSPFGRKKVKRNVYDQLGRTPFGKRDVYDQLGRTPFN